MASPANLQYANNSEADTHSFLQIVENSISLYVVDIATMSWSILLETLTFLA
jgi:hypothetical protein